MIRTQKATEEIGESVGKVIESTTEGVSVWSQYFTSERLFALLSHGVAIALTIVMFALTYQVLLHLMKRFLGRQKKKANPATSQELDTLENLLHSILFYAFIFIALVAVFSILGVNMRGLIASAGVAGLAIAFVSQSIIKDWVTGIFIIIEKQYNVGDWVTVAGRHGQVQSLGMRSTTLISNTGEIIIVPNGTIEDIVNHSILPQLIIVDIPASYKAEADQVLKALREAVKVFNDRYAELLISPAQVLGIAHMEENLVQYRISYSSSLPDSFSLTRGLREESLRSFQNCNIPSPQIPIVFMTGNKESGEEAPPHAY